ncbi:T9SS type A sorting domain-containing protein [Winogradskyella algicola]|uniref:T9SS type A sorting domain-containing protein n=1 Tax=Winogradskyella algicola TaxID=2575815 RepID=UPI001FE2587A|nr:T9SS type A sorting domain-containing protein [Winogradskyella algicola]
MTKKTTIIIIIMLLLLFQEQVIAQISNLGDFKIVSGTEVSFTSNYENSGNHNSDGNLYLNSNFVNNGTTTANGGTTFFKSITNDNQEITGSTNQINFYNLEVDMTSPSAKGLSIADAIGLHLGNSLHIKNGDLRLLGESQLIQANSGLDINTIGSGKLLIDQQGDSSVHRFNYWSSPVNRTGDFSISTCVFDGTDASLNPFSPQPVGFNNGFPYNGLPSVTDGSGNVTTPLTINKYWLYTYAMGNGTYADWLSIDENSALSPGQGFTMKGTGASSSQQNYVFYGDANNGDYSFSINSGESALLGNPYPSALDAQQFLTDNASVVDALYFWVDGGSNTHYLTDYLGGYAVRNLTGGVTPSVASSLISGIGNSGTVTAPSQYVSVGQGFFVQASNSGTIQFNNAQRIFKTESASETTFYRNSESTTYTNKYIRIGYEDPEGFHRQLLLGFMPNSQANENFNHGYDALINGLREDDLFFVIEDNINSPFAIQGVGDFNEQMEFDLALKVSETGIHSIMIDALENFDHPIFLRDNYTNTEYDLTDANYEFNPQQGDFYNRYSLAFLPMSALDVEENTMSKPKVYYNGVNAIEIYNYQRATIDKIEIYNTLGQLVLTKVNGINDKERISIPFTESKGVYVILLKTENTQITTKILTY